MNQISFSLDGHPYIELNKLLKTCNIAQSGGEAKMLIKDGQVSVNNNPEDRIRRKLYQGDMISVGSDSIQVVQ